MSTLRAVLGFGSTEVAEAMEIFSKWQALGGPIFNWIVGSAAVGLVVLWILASSYSMATSARQIRNLGILAFLLGLALIGLGLAGRDANYQKVHEIAVETGQQNNPDFLALAEEQARVPAVAGGVCSLPYFLAGILLLNRSRRGTR